MKPKPQTENSLKKDLLALLTGADAHASFDDAIRNLPPELRGQHPANAPHSAWEIVEHLRIAQWDIVEYALNPKHKSPDFPAGYWPQSPEPPDAKAWEKSVESFRKDRKKLVAAIEDSSTDLLAPIPHANNQTLLSKTLLLADHNAYHIGQLILTRRLLNAWPE
jgi:DinB superfamily